MSDCDLMGPFSPCRYSNHVMAGHELQPIDLQLVLRELSYVTRWHNLLYVHMKRTLTDPSPGHNNSLVPRSRCCTCAIATPKTQVL